MRVFVLTETDSTDYKWCYNETFHKREDAVKRMRQLYHENIVERNELVVASEYDEDAGKASGEMVDGLFISWNIKECDVM